MKGFQMDKKKDKRGVDRRTFLKFSGAAAAALGGVGLGLFGYRAGKDPMSRTGMESFTGAAQDFDRDRFVSKSPHYEKTGATRRVDARTEVVFNRVSRLRRQWNDQEGLEGLEKILRDYYRRYPEHLELDLKLQSEIFPAFREDREEYGEKFILAKAWSGAMGSVWPQEYNRPPAKSDFPRGDPFGEPSEPLPMKSPTRTSKLIKMISYQLGSVLTGITELNPDWVYRYPMPRRGFDTEKILEIPKHWKYAIVVGSPMTWDPFYANPNYGTSFDAYSRSRITAYRLAAFIKQLGYPARAHTPGSDYDLMVPPVAVDAGLGEQGRHGVLITPELGSNYRPAVITTSLPMETDRPIDFGVQGFCKSCKICAENCPSGAITFEGREVVRGYRRYRIDIPKCHNFWYSNLGNIGCRLCVAVCPYSRKSNWVHRSALHVTANDPTGLSHPLLTGMQKTFFPAPDPADYFSPSLGGKNESYRPPPWWLRTEDFIDI